MTKKIADLWGRANKVERKATVATGVVLLGLFLLIPTAFFAPVILEYIGIGVYILIMVACGIAILGMVTMLVWNVLANLFSWMEDR